MCGDEMEISPHYVNHAPAGELHGFRWTQSVGGLPATYNNMIGYYDIPNPKAVHFTDGGPWQGIENHVLYSYEWKKIYDNLLKAKILS